MKPESRLGRIVEAVAIAALTALCNAAIDIGCELYKETKERKRKQSKRQRKSILAK